MHGRDRNTTTLVQPQDIVPDGGGMEERTAGPVLNVLLDVSTCLATLEEEAGTWDWSSLIPGPSST